MGHRGETMQDTFAEPVVEAGQGSGRSDWGDPSTLVSAGSKTVEGGRTLTLHQLNPDDGGWMGMDSRDHARSLLHDRP